MNENQIIFLFCVFAVVTRIPRIVERWKAPLLRGPDWFFNVQTQPGFLKGPGSAILNLYRWQLFVPWAIELPIFLAFLITGHNRYIIPLIAVVTLFTRLNYYLDRKRAEDRARRFEVLSATAPAASVALSLQPRTLRQYTKPWVEAVIALALLGSLAWLGYRYRLTSDWHLLRRPLTSTIMAIYLQAGLLLVKLAFIRARSVAPAENAEQYLAWRDSLRRLSTTLCDYARVMLAFIPPIAALQSVTASWKGSREQSATGFCILAGCAIITWYEWRHRIHYLEVARRTKPANFLIRPDLPEQAPPLCFRPAVPMFLLSRPGGYALNLASAPAKVAALYLAGYAALVTYLPR